MPSPINYYIKLTRLYIGRNGMRLIVRKRGQALLDYGIILTIVVMALTGLQLYVRRTLQARYKDATNKAIREIRQASEDVRVPLQYEPYYQDSDITTKTDSKITHSYSPGGVSSTAIDHEQILRTGVRKELPYSDGAW